MLWEKLLTFAPAIGAAGTVFGGFALLETLVSREAKASITAWLLNLDTRSVGRGWPNQFITLFDTVFGNKHFSLKCFGRSCLASAGLSCLWLAVMYVSGHEIQIPELHPVAIAAIPLTSLLPDYVSLLKTRFILHLTPRFVGLWKRLFLVTMDIISVFAIWYIFLVLYMVFSLLYELAIGHHIILTGVFSFIFLSISEAYYIMIARIFVRSSSILQAFFVASYFTSLWVLLYIVSGLISRVIIRSHRSIRGLVRFFDVKTKPLRSMGYVAGFVSAVVTWIVTVAL